MQENPRFMDQFNNLVDKDHKEVNLTTHAKLTKIQNADGATFFGILMEKSIIVPFTASAETDESIKNIVRLNNMDLDKNPDEAHAQAACRLLKLCFNGENDGFYSDGSSIKGSNIMVLHIYPKDSVETQDEFIKRVSQVFISRGSVITIEETP